MTARVRQTSQGHRMWKIGPTLTSGATERVSAQSTQPVGRISTRGPGARGRGRGRCRDPGGCFAWATTESAMVWIAYGLWDEEGNYCKAVDQEMIKAHFEVISASSVTDLFGVNLPVPNVALSLLEKPWRARADCKRWPGWPICIPQQRPPGAPADEGSLNSASGWLWAAHRAISFCVTAGSPPSRRTP
jgi:hypothetical protein